MRGKFTWPPDIVRARQAIARQVREWRQAVRDGRAVRVERHRARGDLPARFVVDWDGRTEEVQLAMPHLRAAIGCYVHKTRLSGSSWLYRYFRDGQECDAAGEPLEARQEPPR